jgi:hypothetical protein
VTAKISIKGQCANIFLNLLPTNKTGSFAMSTQAAVFAFLFPGSAMVNSLLATAYISIFPNLLLYFVPPDIDTSSLNTLVSFAVGKYSLTLF